LSVCVGLQQRSCLVERRIGPQGPIHGRDGDRLAAEDIEGALQHQPTAFQ